MMNMMVKDVYRNFSAASEKVLVPKICVLDRGQLTDQHYNQLKDIV